MVVDSTGKAVIQGKNLDFLRDLCCGNKKKGWAPGTNLPDVLCDTGRLFKAERQFSTRSAASQLLLLQLCLLHLTLDPTICNRKATRFRESQEAVYACRKSRRIF